MKSKYHIVYDYYFALPTYLTGRKILMTLLNSGIDDADIDSRGCLIRQIKELVGLYQFDAVFDGFTFQPTTTITILIIHKRLVHQSGWSDAPFEIGHDGFDVLVRSKFFQDGIQRFGGGGGGGNRNGRQTKPLDLKIQFAVDFKTQQGRNALLILVADQNGCTFFIQATLLWLILWLLFRRGEGGAVSGTRSYYQQ
jgi:hypothetical protein